MRIACGHVIIMGKAEPTPIFSIIRPIRSWSGAIGGPPDLTNSTALALVFNHGLLSAYPHNLPIVLLRADRVAIYVCK